MKRYILLAAMAFAGLLLLSGCAKEKKIRENLVGEWHLVTDAEDIDVWMCLEDGGSVELFQKTGEGRHYSYRGTWELSEDVISGRYNDSLPWGSSYRVSFSGYDSMTFTALNGSQEVTVYVREAVPRQIRENALVQVKSSAKVMKRIL